MGTSFNWKIVGALILAALLVLAAAWFAQFYASRQRPAPVKQESNRPQAVSESSFGTASGTQTFGDFINSLPESKKECVKRAYGPIYDNLIKGSGFLIPAEEEWRVDEANKCFK